MSCYLRDKVTQIKQVEDSLQKKQSFNKFKHN